MRAATRTFTLEGWSLGDWQTNCYLLHWPATREAVIVDAGFDPKPLLDRVAELGVSVRYILLTHGHLDHIGGLEACKAATGAPVLIHPDDAPMLTDPRRNFSSLFGQPLIAPAADRLLRPGEAIEVGGDRIEVRHTPGHSPGSVSFVLPGHVLGGDALFAGSIGRTDFPGGDFDTLVRSIWRELFSLPPETVVWPGHGPSTTVGDEREYNPFVGGRR